MSGFFSDLFSGNLSGAWEDVVKAFQKLPVPVQNFIVKLESDEGALLETLAETGVQDVVAGGFTTASFVASGKDIVAKALAQGKTIAISDAIAQLNILASSLRPAPTAIAPTEVPAADPNPTPAT